jgi:hypothetical protein
MKDVDVRLRLGPDVVRTGRTSKDARVEFSGLEPSDDYEVRADQAGYASVVQTEVSVRAGRRTSIFLLLTSLDRFRCRLEPPDTPTRPI